MAAGANAHAPKSRCDLFISHLHKFIINTWHLAAEVKDEAPPAKEANPQMIQFIREDWVQKQMRLRTNAFTETVNLRCVFASSLALYHC